MHRYAKRRYAPTVTMDMYDNDDSFLIERSHALNESHMLQNLAKLQKHSNTMIMPTFIGRPNKRMYLCGVILRTINETTWFDFDDDSCKLVSARKLFSTDMVSIRKEIHKGGLFCLTHDMKVSVRCAK